MAKKLTDDEARALWALTNANRPDTPRRERERLMAIYRDHVRSTTPRPTPGRESEERE